MCDIEAEQRSPEIFYPKPGFDSIRFDSCDVHKKYFGASPLRFNVVHTPDVSHRYQDGIRSGFRCNKVMIN
jgi:hypothetical protein